MLKRTKRIAALLLAAIMLLLCACSGQNGKNPNGGASAVSAGLESVNYKGSYKQMDGKRAIGSGCFAGDGRFYYESSGQSVDTDSDANAVFSCLPDGSDVKRLEGFSLADETYVDESSVSMRYINGIFPGEDDCVYVQEVVSISASSEAAAETRFLIHKASLSSDEQTIVDFTDALPKNIGDGFAAVEIDPKGNVYCLLPSEALFVYNANGDELFGVGKEIGSSRFVSVSGEKVLLAKEANDYYSDDIFAVNLVSKKIEKVMSVSKNGLLLYFPGIENYDFTYSNGTSLFGADTSSGECSLILSFANCGVDSQSLFTVLPVEGGLSCVNREYGTDTSGNPAYSWGITKLERIEGEEKVDGKIVLTLATASESIDDSIYKAMLKFNQTNTEYMVQIKDYSVYSAAGDTFAGSTVLNTEIMSGRVPDMFISDSVDSSAYADRGIFENLWPYIDADKELGGRDALVLPVFNSMCHRNGDLYEITPTFSIYYIAGNQDVVGDGSDWSLEKLKSALAEMPAGSPVIKGYSRTNMLYAFSKFRLNDFVDWESNTCSFNTPEFEECLTFIRDYFPAETEFTNWRIDYEMFSKENNLLISDALFCASDFQTISYLYKNKESFVGWPGATSGSCSFQAGSSLAMSSACKHKDAAWEFMRLVLTEEIQLADENNEYHFCTNKKVFDSSIEKACTPVYAKGANGENYELPQSALDIGGMKISLYAMTEEQRGKLLSVIENTTYNVSGGDGTVFEIVYEEAEAFFSGKQDAKKAAEAVQQRVTLYMSEKK